MMLENFFKATYLMFNQIKVVHSIPGRLRLFVPNLSKIPEELKKYIINKNFKYYKIYASYGFNGWILCEDIMLMGT